MPHDASPHVFSVAVLELWAGETTLATQVEIRAHLTHQDGVRHEHRFEHRLVTFAEALAWATLSVERIRSGRHPTQIPSLPDSPLRAN